MTKPAAWSYSALTSFETCPRRHFLTRVSKQVIEPPSEAIKWGNEVHKALELFAKGEKGLPPALQQYERYVKKIIERDGKRLVEAKMAMNNGFRPVSWFAKDAWVRGIVDIGVVGSGTAYLLDWKTGKRKEDSDQLKLMAAMAFAHYPHITRVVAGFIWLKEALFDKEVYTRDDLPEIWNDFLPRVARLQKAHEENKWPAKPSGLCRAWCPVGKKHCEFCGE